MQKLFNLFLIGFAFLCIIIGGCSKNSESTEPTQAKCSIFVISSPSGASIYLDNVETGRVTPDTLHDVRPGVHSIKVTYPNYADTMSTVTANVNQLLKVSLTMRAIESIYKGTWSGTTSQNLPVYFRVNKSGYIDSLVVRIRMDLRTETCTEDFPYYKPVEIKNDTFYVFLSIPITNMTTRLHGRFSSQNSADGNYDEYFGSYYIVCGGNSYMGNGATTIQEGTFSAIKLITKRNN